MQIINRKFQTGSALLTAMIIVVFAAVILAMLSYLQRLASARTQLLINSEQAYQFALGAEDLALMQLRSLARQAARAELATQSTENSTAEQDTEKTQTTMSASFNPLAKRLWPLRLPAQQWGQAILQVQIDNLQGRFNMMNLRDSSERKLFAKLITLLNAESSTNQINLIALNWTSYLRDRVWAHEDEQYEVNSPEDSETKNKKSNTKKTQPQQSNKKQTDTEQMSILRMPILSISELLNLDAANTKFYYVIQPYVTMLPTSTTLDVNALSKPILMALVPKLSPEQADSIIEIRRRTGGFATVDEFITLVNTTIRGEGAADDADSEEEQTDEEQIGEEQTENDDSNSSGELEEDNLSVGSNYFMITSKVKYQQQTVILYTLVNIIKFDGEDRYSIFILARNRLEAY